jgi:hypothetical protein
MRRAARIIVGGLQSRWNADAELHLRTALTAHVRCRRPPAHLAHLTSWLMVSVHCQGLRRRWCEQRREVRR